MTDLVLREQLAAIEHARWGGWQEYLHSKCEKQPDGSLLIPAGYVAALEKQIATPYVALSEPEKEFDREEVDKYLPLIQRRVEFVDGTPDPGVHVQRVGTLVLLMASPGSKTALVFTTEEWASFQARVAAGQYSTAGGEK